MIRSHSGMKTKLLVVDKHAGFAPLLQRAFPEFEVRQEVDGPAGLSTAHDWCPDVLLLELTLPGMRENEFAEKAAESENLRQAPIFYLSAMVESAEDGEPVLMHGHLTFGKPFKLDSLKRHIELQLAGSTRARASEGTRKGRA